MTSLRLRPLGRRTWAEFLAALPAQPMRWYWADQQGTHLSESLPPEAPLTTHVWGWGCGGAPEAGPWVRARVDLGHTVGAVLSSDVPAADDAAECVDVIVRGAQGRSPREQDMLDAKEGEDNPLREAPMTILQVTGKHAMTFLEVREP